ncbi:O-methyltransferase [Stigmatella aurantiaca]|uniref:O-methyltransferase, family 3 n=1 Tax=Stigmatella aurantiaca (strain DW4/3-1) TaxID=378806 RepID=Q097I9_STIAD|nr:class I SAM-dependent methyltransferase [Stigmatella aurantiaca]ADO69890.1 O-methyltransferase, family 3 [Stigmatella aurantiaca DW4/3-1]EAU67914.1 O-methyltransferase, family 3 [Stigmatella aurantiaca DW4/3-1]
MPSTLHEPTVSALLTHLFADARKTDAAVLAPLRQQGPDAQGSLHQALQSDYRQFYTQVAAAYLPVSEELGRLLYALARARRAKILVEFGTSFGISTIHLAAALRDEGGGTLITTEFEPSKVRRARENLTAAGLVHLVEFREGDALETLRAPLPGPIDLLLLDGAKPLYLPILERLEPQLAPGAVVVADNVKMSPGFAEHIARPSNGYTPIALPWDGDDCLFAVRTP